MTMHTLATPTVLDLKLNHALRDRVMEFVTREYDISHGELLSHRRQHHLVEARALFVWIVKTYRPEVSYPVIGKWLGGRDHSSIIASHQKAVELRGKDMRFDRRCTDFAAIMRHAMEIPHGCE